MHRDKENSWLENDIKKIACIPKGKSETNSQRRKRAPNTVALISCNLLQ